MTGRKYTKVSDLMRKIAPHALLVGGAVRDELLGLEAKDEDFMVPGAGHEEIKTLLADYGYTEDLFVGGDYKDGERIEGTGTSVGVRFYPFYDGAPPGGVEVAAPRAERSTGPGRHDFEVVSSPEITIREDALRRDFTINAIYKDLHDGLIEDPLGGLFDLEQRVLRTTSRDSFRDDPLRMMRALRFMSQLNFALHPVTRWQMREHASSIANISGERIQMELNKLLLGGDPAQALRTARDLGLLVHFLPEFGDVIGFEQQSKHHDLTTDEHTFLAIEIAAKCGASLEVRLALLFHDLGKPQSSWMGADGRLHYYANPTLGKQAHEVIGAEMARIALRRLRYSTDVSSHVVYLVRNHMVNAHNSPRPIRARKFLAEHGDRAFDLIAHRRADTMAKGDALADAAEDIDVFERIMKVESSQPLRIADLAVDGRDLIGLGYHAGPGLGAALQHLLRLVIGQPGNNTRPILLKEAGRVKEEFDYDPMQGGKVP